MLSGFSSNNSVASNNNSYSAASAAAGAPSVDLCAPLYDEDVADTILFIPVSLLLNNLLLSSTHLPL